MIRYFHLLVFLLPLLAFSQGDDRGEAPYIEASGAEGQTTYLPLREVCTKVSIAGTIAQVTSRQVYTNDTDSHIHAKYVFPGSTRAAVSGMEMKIGSRTVVAQITEKKEAETKFQEVVQTGKTASLLQQYRPNVFEMHLGNITPGETLTVQLDYTELLIPNKGTYEFVYPTIVGKRYNGEQPTKENWIENPFAQLDQGNPKCVQAPIFDISVSLHSPIPIQALKTQSHQCKIDYLSPEQALINLDNGHQMENKDFILQYRLKDEEIATGIMLYEGKEENFFLYMGQAPERVPSELIPPREYFFILDVSGSMNGFPIQTSKTLIRKLLNGLRPEDTFNVLLFAASSESLSATPLPASPDNIQQALTFIDSQNGAGGTHLLNAVEKAFSMTSKEASTSFVILTDGFVTIEEELFSFIEGNIGHANFFSFGIGGSVNRHLIEGVAHVGHTEPFIVTNPSQADSATSLFKEYIGNPVLTNISISFDGMDVYDVLPKSVPDLMAEKPIIIYGKWKGRPKGKVAISGLTGKGSFSKETRIKKELTPGNTEALQYLWARKKVQILSDYQRIDPSDEKQAEITNIGLTYSILTDFTSFLAIDNQSPKTELVHTPHGNPGAVPEPHEWALITVGLLFLLYYYRHKLSLKTSR